MDRTYLEARHAAGRIQCLVGDLVHVLNIAPVHRDEDGILPDVGRQLASDYDAAAFDSSLINDASSIRYFLRVLG